MGEPSQIGASERWVVCATASARRAVVSADDDHTLAQERGTSARVRPPLTPASPWRWRRLRRRTSCSRAPSRAFVSDYVVETLAIRADAEAWRWAACGPRAIVLAADRRVRGSPAGRRRYVPERTTRALFRPNLVALAVAAVAASGTRGRDREEVDEHRRRAVQSARLPPGVTPIQSAISASRPAVMPVGRSSPRTWIGHKRQRGKDFANGPMHSAIAVSAGRDSKATTSTCRGVCSR